MDLAFLKILNMSISASWLVLVVLVLRFLLKKSPRWIHVCLWALVAVRLVCPVSIESVLSLIPSRETVPQEIIYTHQPAIESGVGVVDQVVNSTVMTSLAPEGLVSINPVQVWLLVGEMVWYAGMVLLLLWALVSYLRLKRKVDASIHLDNGVYLCDYIDTPFILGIIRPKIYLPSAMEPDAASHVLAHERAHIARRDHWWKPLGYLLLTIHWFNPLMWLAYILLCRDIELACDEKVVRQMALPERKSYSDALLMCSVKRMHIAACPLAFGEVGVKERVKTVLNYKKPAFWIVLVAIIALIITAVCFLTDPVQKNEFFGKTYQAEKIVYRDPVQSYQMTETELPLIQISQDGELKRKPDTGDWENLGALIEIQLTRQNLTDLFYAQGMSLEEGITLDRLLEENQEAWLARIPNPNQSGSTSFYLLLRQSGGEVYLGQGIAFAPDVEPLRESLLDASSYIKWLFRMNVVPYEDDTADTFGNYYRVNGQVYESGVAVGAAYLSWDQVYFLTDGGAVIEMDNMEQGVSSIARLASVELTEQAFDAYFIDNPGLGTSLRENNAQAWCYFGNDKVNADQFFYLLRQKDGTHYMVCGGWEESKGRESARVGVVFQLQSITSDNPYQEADSPFQWTLNLDSEHIDSVQITSLESDGREKALSDSEIWYFLQVLNSIKKDQITVGTLVNAAKVQAMVQCCDANGHNPALDVALSYDGEAVSLTFREGDTWIIRNDWINSFFFPYSAMGQETDPFADPDSAFQLCRNIRAEYVNYAWFFENVQVDPHSAQAHVRWLNAVELQELAEILRSLPETAFEIADYPAQSDKGVDIIFRNLWMEESVYPTANLTLLDGALYYTFYVDWQNLCQTWKISDEALVSFLEAHLSGDKSTWDRFAPQVFVEGEVGFEVNGLQISVPKVRGFEYEVSDEGLRFRPEGQEGWVLVQYCTEPFAVCGTGLQLMPGATNYGAYQINTGCYDGNEVWSFKDIKADTGDMVYNVVFLNEENARWVMDCENEIWEIIRGLAFSHPAFQGRSIPNRVLEEPFELNWLYWSQLSEAEYAAELRYEEDGKSGSVQVSYDGKAYTVTDEAGSRNYLHCVKSQAETTPGTLMEVFFLTDDQEMTIGKYCSDADILPTEVIHVDIRTFDAAESYGVVPESLKGLMEMGDEWSPRFYCQDSVFYCQYAAAMSSVRVGYGLNRVDYQGNELCEITVKGIPQEILELEDGGFVVYTQSYEDSLYELSCFDKAGELRWCYSFEEAGSSYVAAMVQKNGDVYCFGEVTPKDSSSDIFIWRLNLDGELVQKRQLGGSDFDSVYRILETKKGFILYGSTQSGDGDLPLSKTGYGVGFRVEVTDDLEPGRAVKADVQYSGTAGYHEGETVYYDDPILKVSGDDMLPEFLNCSASIFDWEDGHVLVRTLNYEAYPYGPPMVSMLTYYHQTVMTGYNSKGDPIWQLAGNVRSG